MRAATTREAVAAMTNHVTRLYALAVSVLVLFLAWAVVATHPWQTKTHRAADPRIRALVIRERHIRHQSLLVRRLVNRRWHHYRIALAKRKTEISAAQRKHQQAVAAAAAAPAPSPSPSSYSSSYSSSPSVQVVTLPPLTVTRTS
jgi:pyruvate/2-oxoglutarate dehydrogenase complex dihydrolipoamide acyltransferase (E2) component